MAELEALADEIGVWSAASDRKACAQGARWCGCVLPQAQSPDRARCPAARLQLLAHLEGFSSRLLDRLQAAEAQARGRPAASRVTAG